MPPASQARSRPFCKTFRHRSRSGCRAPLRSIASLALRQKRNRNAHGDRKKRREISAEPLDRRFVDGCRQLLLGGTRSRESRKLLPALARQLSNWKACPERGMAARVDSLHPAPTLCRREYDQFSAQESLQLRNHDYALMAL